MILYFSGTGNSQYIAEVINNELQDEIVNIADDLKIFRTYQSDKPYIFVLPTYAYRMPRVVEEFISNHHFKGNKNVYVILTCGASIGNASKYAKQLFDNKDMVYKGLFPIVMPDNYIVMYNPTSNDEALSIIEQGREKALQTIQYILENKEFPIIKNTFINDLMSNYGNQLFYNLMVNDKGFKVNDNCIHCLKCVDSCPLSNIKYVNKEIMFQGQCTHCMNCINICPKEAIVYKNMTKSRNHYHISKIIKKHKEL